MSVRSRCLLRKKLHQVLEDWISEELGDSSDSENELFDYIRRRRRIPIMEPSKYHQDPRNVSSEDERISSRASSSSTATDHLPAPPKYESVIQRPVKDYTNNGGTKTRWEREVNQIVGDFDKKCATSSRDSGFSSAPQRLSSGAQSYLHEESTSRSSISPTASSSDRNFDWDKGSLLSNDDFFRDNSLRQRRPFGAHPFAGMRSRFGEDIDRFFGRGTFSTDWDTFFPEITFSDFGRSSSSLRSRTQPTEVQQAAHEQDFKLEVDVQGFEPHELLVKTVGHNLQVMAKTGGNDEGGAGNRKREFREMRREFTIPPHINPTDITSNLTPEGFLVIEAPAGNARAIQSRDEENRGE